MPDLRRHPSSRALGYAALLALAVAAAVPFGARSAELKPWRHGILEAKSDAGIAFMVTRGFAEKQGLALETIQFKSDVPALQALLSGELDSYEAGAGPAIVAAARGADVKIIGCYWPGLPLGFFVRAGIAAVQDLKGKTFAISAPGAAPDLLAHAVLARYGVPVSEVSFANLGSDLDRFKALSAGVVDAAVVSDEYTPIAAKGGMKLLVAGRDVLPNFIRFCTQSTGKTLAARPDDAVRFVAAEIAALRYALSHRAEELQLTREITGAKPEDLRPEYIFDDAVAHDAIDPSMPLPMEKLAWMQDQFVQLGTLPHAIDPTLMVDEAIRDKALQRVGP